MTDLQTPPITESLLKQIEEAHKELHPDYEFCKIEATENDFNMVFKPKNITDVEIRNGRK